MESPTGHLAQHATRRAPAWVGWNAAAMAAVVWHALIDQHIGLTGPTSREMTFHQGSAALTFALLIAWWAWVAGRATAGDEGALRATVWMVVAFGAVFHGLIALVSAFPPSDAFPYQDMAHVAALGCGATAAHRMRAGIGWGAPGRLAQISVGLLLLNAAVRGGLMAMTVPTL